MALLHLADQLMGDGLWLSANRFRAFLRTQRQLGMEFEAELIDPAWRSGPRLSRGGANAFTVAFGYSVGQALHFTLARDEGANPHDGPPAARLCALFNFGISLFDLVCDGRPSGLASLTTAFDEDLLRRLLGDPRAPEQLHLAAGSIGDPLLRFLLSAVAAFFVRLRAFGQEADGRARDHLAALLVDAYRAEIGTVRHARTPGTGTSTVDLLAMAHRKSVLPFEVMLAIARLRDGAGGRRDGTRATLLGKHLGLLFSLVDDLVDLNRDVVSGDVNTILLGAGIAPGPKRIVGVGQLDALGDSLADASARISTHLGAAVRLLGHGQRQRDGRAFWEIPVGYTQRWVRPGSPLV